ncbi:MAG: PRC-barrel domain-containing protein [Hyphomicrobiaceae bacterium]
MKTGEAVVLSGRAARAALAAVVVALWAGLQGPTLAQSPAGEPGPQKPAEGAPQKPAEDGAQKQEDSVPKSRLVSILGRDVTNREGDGGRVIDVLVDMDGRSGAVVVEFGGFMGIGSRKVAVDWSALRFVREGNRTSVTVEITRDQIRKAAEYKPGEPTSVLSAK